MCVRERERVSLWSVKERVCMRVYVCECVRKLVSVCLCVCVRVCVSECECNLARMYIR